MGVPLPYNYELYYPNTKNNSQCGGFQVHVLPEHIEFCFKQDLKLNQFDLLTTNQTNTYTLVIITFIADVPD